MINGKTELYGIVGHPVAHSLSPAIHNAGFRSLGLNKVYVPLPVTDLKAAIIGLRALGFRGVSVTIPHKRKVLDLIDSVEPPAAKIGAVNTLVMDKKGGIHGLNTDWLGANRALEEEIRLAGSRILVIGAGGAARAIGFGLREAGAEVILVNRTKDRAAALARSLHCDYTTPEKIGDVAADALVNATSVGMEPGDDKTPVPPLAVGNFPVVMDIVYAPRQTRLLREAAAAGCRTIDGLQMLLYQGVAQFELWTGKEAPVQEMRRALVGALPA